MIPVIIIVALLVAALIGWINMSRHGESRSPSEDWNRTDEVFRDPSTNRVMRVWTDDNGARHYVPED